AIFALIVLLLSGVGLYAVVAYSVTQRTQEIGVRMALGAQGNQVTWMILRRGLLQLTTGLSIGLVGGYFAGRALPSQILVGTTSNDPRVLAAITIILSVVAITACIVPARRAMRVDPLVALRADGGGVTPTPRGLAQGAAEDQRRLVPSAVPGTPASSARTARRST